MLQRTTYKKTFFVKVSNLLDFRISSAEKQSKNCRTATENQYLIERSPFSILVVDWSIW